MTTTQAALPRSPSDYPALIASWLKLSKESRSARYRWQARNDLYFLLRYLLSRRKAEHPWVFARCREVQANPDGHLDLWAREHWKSSIITFAQTIRDVLIDPEVTIGIFSHTRPMAKKFLGQIKQEFETNAVLKDLFPDVLWQNPARDAPRWSEDAGIVLKRRSNPKESTVEAWGLVDSQPTGTHFAIRIYDDVIDRNAVNTAEMIQKATEAWEHSINLGISDGGRERYIGTRYAVMDTYSTILARGIAKPRIYPSTHDGTESGKPILFNPEEHERRRRAMGPVTFAAQMLQKPISKATATFDVEHLHFAEIRPNTLNVYILGDYAHSRRRGSDRTAIPVIAVDAQRNFYLVDGLNHRMNLTERWTAIKTLRRKWRNTPGVQGVFVGYERYGAQSDIEHFEAEMERDGDAFEIKELAWPREGPGAKGDRIQRLRPDFEQGHFFLSHLAFPESGVLSYLRIVDGELKYVPARPEGETKLMTRAVKAGEKHRLMRPIRPKDEEGRPYDLTVRFIVEYLSHPAPGSFDDLIDAVSRIHDMEVRPPVMINPADLECEPEAFFDS